MENFKGKMYTVHSGNIAKIGWEYDETNKNGVLRIVFLKTGRTYDYWPVKKEIFSQIFKEESKGKYIQQNIINNKEISYEEVDL